MRRRGLIPRGRIRLESAWSSPDRRPRPHKPAAPPSQAGCIAGQAQLNSTASPRRKPVSFAGSSTLFAGAREPSRMGIGGNLGMEYLTFGVRRLAAALRPASHNRPQSGSKLPHSKLAVLIPSHSHKDRIVTHIKRRGTRFSPRAPPRAAQNAVPRPVQRPVQRASQPPSMFRIVPFR
jgi:hypothetical protein